MGPYLALSEDHLSIDWFTWERKIMT